MKLFYSFFLALLLFACQQNTESETTNTSSEDHTNNTTGISPTENEGITKVESTDIDSLMKDFPKEWQALTNQNQEFVFMRPCDAENQRITFKQQANGTYQIHYLLGQEAVNYRLVAMSKRMEVTQEDTMTYYDLSFSEIGTNEVIQQSTVTFSTPKQASWSGIFGGNNDALYAPKAHFAHYPTLNMPCTECFEEEVCTSPQDWGIGVLKPVFKETIYLYNNKTDSQPAKEIQFSNGMISNYDDLGAWSNFESFHPNYDVCYIRCLAEKDGWYQILANQDFGRVMWVKKSAKLQFLTWENYLKSALAMMVLQPKKNLMRAQKGKGKVMYSDCTGGFKVLAMEGQYVKVKWDELTSECESGQHPDDEGWIQWRDETKLHIWLAWAM